MNRSNLIRLGLGTLAFAGVLFASADHSGKSPSLVTQANAGETQAPVGLEVRSAPEAIKEVALRGAPIAIWATLEHGERTECLDCISYVEPLLYDKDYRVREIAAWWLRRRVFGYAEVALKVRKVIAEDADPVRRAAAANALGEFMDGGATKLLVTAVQKDTSPLVRSASLAAIKRLNDAEGVPAVATGLKDADASVRQVAVDTAMHLGGFTDAAAVAPLLSDPDAIVRAKAADALGLFRAKGSGAGLAALAQTDADEEVRIAAVNALGELGDPATRATLEKIQANDASSRVRDAARIAAIKLVLPG